MQRCHEGINRAQLSQWRDGTFTSHEQQALATHIARCPACQRRLVSYERIAQALRQEASGAFAGRDLWRVLVSHFSSYTTKGQTRPMRHRRVAIPALTATILISMLAVLFLITLSLHTTTPPTSLHRTPSTSQTVSPSPSTVPKPPGDDSGWRAVANIPSYVTAVGFAPSNKEIGYVCVDHIAPGTNTTDGPYTVMMTHDGGKTWQSRAPNIPFCNGININPYNPSQLALEVYNTENTAVFQSIDSGQTWKLVEESAGNPLPGSIPTPTPASLRYPDTVTIYGWVADTLLVHIRPNHTSQDGSIATSVHGGPLTPLPWNSPTREVTTNSLHFLIGARLYIPIFIPHYSQSDPTQIQSVEAHLYETDDLGVHWQLVSMVAPDPQSNETPTITLGADNKTLFAMTKQGTLLKSSADLGQTWTDVARVPSPYVGWILSTTPDDTIYIGYHLASSDNSQTIVKVNPGSNQLTAVATTAEAGDIALTWDINGHPLFLWRPLGANLQYHPA